METRKFRTDIHCESCIQKITPFLNGEKTIDHWKVDMESPDKILSVTGNSVDPNMIKALMEKAGYDAVEDGDRDLKARILLSLKTYLPLILIFLYLSGGVVLTQMKHATWDWAEAMGAFMGGFFIIFSFFKMLNLKGFMEAYSTYDLIAQRWMKYGYIYPFIELALGIAYWSGAFRFWTNVATILVMGVSSLGVIQSLRKKRKIQCACLGTVFNLPMTSVTLFEDFLMVGMAGVALFFG